MSRRDVSQDDPTVVIGMIIICLILWGVWVVIT